MVFNPFFILKTGEKFPAASALIAEHPAYTLGELWLKLNTEVLSPKPAPAFVSCPQSGLQVICGAWRRFGTGAELALQRFAVIDLGNGGSRPDAVISR